MKIGNKIEDGFKIILNSFFVGILC